MFSTDTSKPVKFGYVLVIGALMLAISIATIVTISILNSQSISQIERVHRVTLCVLLTEPENRTPDVILECRDNTPSLDELPGIARQSP